MCNYINNIGYDIKQDIPLFVVDNIEDSMVRAFTKFNPSIGNYKKAQWLARIMLAYERCKE